MTVNQLVFAAMEQLEPFLTEGQAVEFDLPVSGTYKKRGDTYLGAVVGGDGRIRFTVIRGKGREKE